MRCIPTVSCLTLIFLSMVLTSYFLPVQEKTIGTKRILTDIDQAFVANSILSGAWPESMGSDMELPRCLAHLLGQSCNLLRRIRRTVRNGAVFFRGLSDAFYLRRDGV